MNDAGRTTTTTIRKREATSERREGPADAGRDPAVTADHRAGRQGTGPADPGRCGSPYFTAGNHGSRDPRQDKGARNNPREVGCGARALSYLQHPQMFARVNITDVKMRAGSANFPPSVATATPTKENCND